MTSLGLGDIGRFPFVEPPDRRNVSAGVQLLDELGALRGRTADPDRQAARAAADRPAARPDDPRGRAARLCARGARHRGGALAAGSRASGRPSTRPQADQQHARFKDELVATSSPGSTSGSYLREQQRELSSSAFRRMCKREFLNYLRVREWQSFESQLRQVCKEMRIARRAARATPPTPTASTRRCSPACSPTSGCWRSATGRTRGGPREYLGARGARFAIFPGSGLKRKNPQFLMAGELVETGRLWARQNAAIKPEWAERIGSHLVKRTYSEPHWSKKRAAVMAQERVTLYGVPLVADRTVSYGKVDPVLSRELFIRHALVYGEWSTHQKFFAENRRLLEEAEELEHRTRRRDLVVDEHTLFDFYDARIPEGIVSGAHFDQWWKTTRRDRPDLLTFDPAMLTHDTVEEVVESDYPEEWQSEGLTFPISYHFEPGAADDGLTIDVPVATLNRVSADDFSWNVPGLREELVASADPQPAQAAAGELRAGPQHRARVPGRRTAGGGAAARLARATPPVDDRRGRAARGVGLVQGRRAPPADLPGGRRGRRGAGPRQGPRGAQGAAAAAVRRRGRRGRRRHDRVRRDDAGPSASCRPSRRGSGPATRCAASRRWSTRATRSGCRCAGRRRRPRRGTGSAWPGCCCSRCRGPTWSAGSTTPASSRSPARRTPPSPSWSRTVAAPSCSTRSTPAHRSATPRRTTRCWPTLGRDLVPRMHEVLASVTDVLARWRRADRVLSGRAELATLPSMTDMRDQLARLVHRGFVAEAGPGPAAPLPDLPDRAGAAARPARRATGPRPAAARPDRRPAGGVPPPGRGAPRRTTTVGGAAPGALAARGVPGVAVGPAARHASPGQ